MQAQVIILGAGLSGLSAAISAAENGAQALVLCPSANPTGSSFANRNNALGIQWPTTDHDKELFFADAVRLATPGFLAPELVTVLTDEADARIRQLLALNPRIRRDTLGAPLRFTGCGSTHPGAIVVEDLGDLHRRMMAQAKRVGVRFIFDAEIISAQPADDATIRIEYALGDTIFTHTASAVVMALGGTAPLHRHRICGPDISGWSLAMLQNAGAATSNEQYLQFMWHDTHGYFPVHSLFSEETRILSTTGESIPLLLCAEKERMDISAGILTQRHNHCPVYYGQPDSHLDLFLSRYCINGTLRVLYAGETKTLTLMAHATNGGAKIDCDGQTTVPGLFAVGECATGMHGANRLGGAMILSTLVFGHRAGKKAARLSIEQPSQPFSFVETGLDSCDEYHSTLKKIRSGMTRHALLAPNTGTDSFAAKLENLTKIDCRRTALAAQSALAIVQALLRAHSDQ